MRGNAVMRQAGKSGNAPETVRKTKSGNVKNGNVHDIKFDVGCKRANEPHFRVPNDQNLQKAQCFPEGGKFATVGRDAKSRLGKQTRKAARKRASCRLWQTGGMASFWGCKTTKICKNPNVFPTVANLPPSAKPTRNARRSHRTDAPRWRRLQNLTRGRAGIRPHTTRKRGPKARNSTKSQTRQCV